MQKFNNETGWGSFYVGVKRRTTMKVRLAYGKEGLDIEVPDWATIVKPVSLKGLEQEKERIIQSFRQPIGTRPLKEMVQSGDRVAIVISDLTRPTPNHKLVAGVLDELPHVPRQNFVIINGTGSHRANTRDELAAMLGEDIVTNIQVMNHDAFDDASLAFVGRTSSGGPVYLNRRYLEADVKIVTGFIEPHFFAGFSGGPKGILPGIAGIKTILHFHSAPMIGSPNSTWGLLAENPVQQEAVEAALMAKPDFMVNVALNEQKEITGIFSGDLIGAHRIGCQFVKRHSMVRCTEPCDIVVTSSGGYPLDQNLYQAVKGISAAQRIVKKGGAILCAAECSDGLPDHGNYARILQMRRTPQEILAMIQTPGFEVFDQWQVQKQAMGQLWADVYVRSELPDCLVEKAMFKVSENINATLDRLYTRYGEQCRVAVLPLGPLTIPYLDRPSQGEKA
jgi:nickel-dependent lactate racemase